MEGMCMRCEAMVLIPNTSKPGMYVQCGQEPADLHHKLTRARGGKILDKAGEKYHLLYLCREHHAMAHDEDNAYVRGLLIHGSVITGHGGHPVYTGPDEYLSEKYPCHHCQTDPPKGQTCPMCGRHADCDPVG